MNRVHVLIDHVGESRVVHYESPEELMAHAERASADIPADLPTAAYLAHGEHAHLVGNELQYHNVLNNIWVSADAKSCLIHSGITFDDSEEE